ncbi:TetR/AcrR family transcriptional regulator [Kribbella sp. NPDC050124]|uniref:TetR/AcrR family transcriptional regulator n=1 Tax=Kribbella sp. NPDC050124 TaxID=3364114 RepID=UPI0037B82FB6
MRRTVLAATVDLLVSEGLQGTTVGAVARAAGVHETSVYRRWKTRENLLADAVFEHANEAIPVPDTGRVRDDLVVFFGAVARFLSSPLGRTLVQISFAQQDGLDDDRIRADWTTRMDRGESMLRRGVERGELPVQTDPHLVLEAISSSLIVRVLLTGEPLDEAVVARLIDLVLDGARTPRS